VWGLRQGCYHKAVRRAAWGGSRLRVAAWGGSRLRVAGLGGSRHRVLQPEWARGSGLQPGMAQGAGLANLVAALLQLGARVANLVHDHFIYLGLLDLLFAQLQAKPLRHLSKVSEYKLVRSKLVSR
jgi:hypothetical protein